MDLLGAAAFLFLLGVAVIKLIQLRRHGDAPVNHAEAMAQIGKAFLRLLGDGRELVLYGLFVGSAIGGLSLSLMAYGPRVSIVALLVCAALFLLWALKTPPKAE